VDVSSNRIGADGLAPLCAFLAACPLLTTLVLSHNPVVARGNGDGWKPLAAAVAALPRLRRLELNGVVAPLASMSAMNDAAMSAVVARAPRDTLEVLRLRDCGVLPDELGGIAASVARMPRLRVLDVGDNPVRNDAAVRLVAACGAALTELGLSGCGIGGDAPGLSDAVARLTRLRKLGVVGNAIHTADYDAIARQLPQLAIEVYQGTLYTRVSN
jgi:hypothetical protein